MPVTYTAIANATSTSGQSSIQITNIPSTYTDLRLTYNMAQTANGYFNIRFNGDSSGNYGQQILRAFGTAKTTARPAGGSFFINSAVAVGTSLDTPLTGWIDIFNYKTTNTCKPVLTWTGIGNSLMERGVGMYCVTTAVTSIQLLSDAAFAVGSRFGLYGILKA